jgi:hypothetical protein
MGRTQLRSSARAFATRFRVVAALIAVLLAAAGASLAHAATKQSPPPPKQKVVRVPQGFIGVNVDPFVFGSDATIDLSQQFNLMVSSGVESVRAVFNWSAAQPFKTPADVPSGQQDKFAKTVGGVPTDFSTTDQIVGDAAQRHLTVLPIVLYSPFWDSRANKNGFDPPQRTAPYAAYLTALIGRYGPHGSYWRSHPGVPKVPIRMWQIWNEPNLSTYWTQPFAKTYIPLLKAAHDAIKKADPGAKVVLAALTNAAWRSIGQVYAIRNARNLFDVVAVNGFTKHVPGVLTYMRLMRHAMSHFKDGKKPLIATEVSWPSAQGKSRDHFDFDTTEAGQARNIAAVVPMLGAQRTQLRLIAFYIYTWVSPEGKDSEAFQYAGLLRYADGSVSAKPALAAFRRQALALELCQDKGSAATKCAKATKAPK